MISHKHKCIFIHIPKTAGMSIENAFLSSLGLRFYAGQATPLLLSYNDNPDVGPPSLAHLAPQDYVAHHYVTLEQFEAYFTFAFVRNPWERAVSIFRHFNFDRVMSFTNFLKYEFPNLQKERYYFVKPQVEYIYDKEGVKLIDFVGRFESLYEDFEEIRKEIAHPVGKLEYINKTKNKKNWYSRWNRRHIYKILKSKPYLIKYFTPFYRANKPYHELYTKEAKAIVDEFYRRDIELLGYEFGK